MKRGMRKKTKIINKRWKLTDNLEFKFKYYICKKGKKRGAK
jgi:hypothetical protein